MKGRAAGGNHTRRAADVKADAIRLMKLFGEALEKRASLCHMKDAERLQGNASHIVPPIARRA
jgi:hypothetical protein